MDEFWVFLGILAHFFRVYWYITNPPGRPCSISLKAKICLHQLNFKNNNGPICYLRIYLGIETDSFLSYVATDHKDGHGLKLEKRLANRCKLKLFPVVHWSDRVARIDMHALKLENFQPT